MSSSEGSRWPRDWVLLAAAGGVLVAVVLLFSQTYAWYGDEESQLLASQLINAGRAPYRDFFSNQTPLYIVVDAIWMRLAGESWRAAHAFSALCSSAAALLLSTFWLERMREPRWKLAAALATAGFVGLHFGVLQYGTIGQAYGFCLLLTVAAFRLALRSADSAGVATSFGTGVCAGAATASTLLAAPVGPILWIWIVTYNRTGSRLRKSLGFLTGGVIPFLPLAWLTIKAPRQVLFDLVRFPLHYRGTPDLRSSARWNFHVLTGWLQSPQGILLGVLALIGLATLFLHGEIDRRLRSSFYLCVWLAAGLTAWLAIPYPTFPQYFVLVLPYVSILATLGLYALQIRIAPYMTPMRVVVSVIVLFVGGLAKSAYARPKEYRARWPRIEAVAHEVDRVTRRNAPILADDGIYFAADRLPLRGLENSDARLMNIPPELAKTMHVELRSTVLQWVAAGRFAAVSSCWPYDRRDDPLALYRLYPNHRTVKGCDLFWK